MRMIGVIWLLLGVIVSLGGFGFGRVYEIERAREELKALTSIIKDRYALALKALDQVKSQTSQEKPPLPQYDLTGTWDYEVTDRRRNHSHKGDCKIIHYQDGRLMFEGHRQKTSDLGTTKKHQPPIYWHSSWAQVTTDNQIRAEYLIELDDGQALGYFVLKAPRAPFDKLTGDYHMLAPNLFFGDVVFKKQYP